MDTRIEYVVTLLVGVIAGVTGLNSMLETPHGMSSSGKSKACSAIQEVIAKLDCTIQRTRFIQGVTSASSLVRALANGGRTATMLADEFGHLIQRHLVKRNDDALEFRRALNAGFSNSSFSREYAAGPGYRLKKTCLSMTGLAQPHMFAEYMCEVLQFNDGLAERMLVVSAPASVPDVQGMEGVDRSELAEQLTAFLTGLADTHADPVTYHLSNEALQFLAVESQRSRQEDMTRMKELERAILEGASTSEAPQRPHDSKVTEIGTRLAISLHFMDVFFNDDLTDSTTISIGCLQRGMRLAQTLVRQTDVFVQLCEKAGKEPSCRSVVPSVNRFTRHPVKVQVALSDGAVVYPDVLRRQNRTIKGRGQVRPSAVSAHHIEATMKELSGKIGQFKAISGIKVFVKDVPSDVDQDALTALNVGMEDYEKSFHIRLTSPPIKPQHITPEKWMERHRKILQEVFAHTDQGAGPAKRKRTG